MFYFLIFIYYTFYLLLCSFPTFKNLVNENSTDLLEEY